MWRRSALPVGDGLARRSAPTRWRAAPSRCVSTHCESPSRRSCVLRLFGATSLAASGAGLYYGYREGLIPFISPLPLDHIDEKLFDSADDLVVVLLPSGRPADYPAAQVERLRSILPKGIRLYYTVKAGGGESGRPPVMLYKGMRKQFYPAVDLLDQSQYDGLAAEMAEFFRPLSQDYATLRQEAGIPEYVTHDTFRAKVVREASARAPVVLQLYEESCFLCFLMRPFINSVNRHLLERGSPVRIKRLNIERNDFPKGCPVTRATPTFVLYDGGPQGTRWSEFKPQDFVRKIVEVAKLDRQSQEYLEALSEDISRRFMLFGRWARWLAQSQAMQESMLTKAPVNEEEVYTRAIKVLMDLDMRRVDDLETNLKCLKNEIRSAEQDCIAIAQMMACEIMKAERARRR